MKDKYIKTNPGVTSFFLDSQDPFIVDSMIERLHALGVPVYSGTEADGFDPLYPTLKWDGEMITQTRDTYKDDRHTFYSPSEFFDKFVVDKSKHTIVALSNNYDASVYYDRVEVGCQTFTKESIEKFISECITMGYEAK